MSKIAKTDYPVHELIAKRWSPYGFSDTPIDAQTIRSLFEAARWAPSSYNEQPWRYIVATREQSAAFDKLLSCLVEMNQQWAKHAPVLALGVVKHDLSNGKPNRAAVHDLGLASAHLTFEATARGLFVHQMIGIDPETARERYAIPDGFEAWTALAIGRAAVPEELSEKYRERDLVERTRRPLSEFVFGDGWETPAPVLD